MHLQRKRSHRSPPRERSASDDVVGTRTSATSTRRDCAFLGQSRKNPVASLRRGEGISFSLRRKSVRVSQTPVASSRNHSGSQRTLRWLFILRVARSRASPRGSSSSAPHSHAGDDRSAGAWSARGRTPIATNTSITMSTRSAQCVIDGGRARRHDSWSDGEQLLGVISRPRLAQPWAW